MLLLTTSRKLTLLAIIWMPTDHLTTHISTGKLQYHICFICTFSLTTRTQKANLRVVSSEVECKKAGSGRVERKTKVQYSATYFISFSIPLE